jgi:hypothetical protein
MRSDRMDLELKPDFEEARDRWAAFWRGEVTDRPLASVLVPRPGAEPVPPPGRTDALSGDLDRLTERVLAHAASFEYVGEALPHHYVTFGPDLIAGLLGAELRVNPDSPDTTWAEPFVEDWDGAELALRRGGRWWRRTVEYVRALRRRCDGRLLLAGPTLSGGLDCLAWIFALANSTPIPTA